MKATFIKSVNDSMGGKGDDVLKTIDWDTWLYGKGLNPDMTALNFSNPDAD